MIFLWFWGVPVGEIDILKSSNVYKVFYRTTRKNGFKIQFHLSKNTFFRIRFGIFFKI